MDRKYVYELQDIATVSERSMQYGFDRAVGR